MRDTILKYMARKKLEKRCDPRRTASFRSSNAALSTEPSGVRQTEMAMRRLPGRTSSGGTLRAACAARTVLAVCRCGPGGVVMAEGVGRRIASSLSFAITSPDVRGRTFGVGLTGSITGEGW